jgi:neopullulanase
VPGLPPLPQCSWAAWTLASRVLFSYPFAVQNLLACLRSKPPRCFPNIRPVLVLLSPALLVATLLLGNSTQSPAASDNSPVVTKIEPPNWWIGLTTDVMVVVSGRGLDATKVECNLANIVVERTQSTAGGKYLFVWLKFNPELRSGTLVCRVMSPTGMTSFELPLATRTETIHRFQGLATADVLYLIMPDRFANGDPTNDEPAEAPGSHDRSKARAYHGGDLRGVRDHLGYLKDLGVTAIWLTPIVRNGAPEDYHGYGAVDLYAVEPHLGRLRDYQDLVSAAHRQGMKVVFDVVPNHVGPMHPWVNNPPLPDWFHGTLQQHANSSASVERSFYGESEERWAGHDPFEILTDPHAPARFSRSLTEGWFFGALPDINTENPVVAQYLLQNAIWWAESSGLDAYRVDTFPYVSRAFWSRWHAGLRRIYPRLTMIGEVFHPDPDVTAFFAGGEKRSDRIDSGVTTVFDYPMYFALRDVLLRGRPAGKLVDVLRHDWLYARPSELVTFFGNHDVPRFASAAGSSAAKTKLAFGLALTLRGIPELYYGDEIGMAGGDDPDNRRDFPGGWSEDAWNAFTEAGRTAEQEGIFSYVRTLLRVRREHSALSSGRLWHLAADDSSYVFLRETEEESVVVAFNGAAQRREMRIPLVDTPAEGMLGVTRLFGEGSAEIFKKELRARVPGESVSIFALN